MNIKSLTLKLTVPVLAAAAAPAAFAGKAADAISAVTTDAAADLYLVGGIVASLVVVSVIFGAAFHLFKKGG